MSPSKPSRSRIPLYPNPPLSPYNPENDIFSFSPIRRDSTPPGPAVSSPSGPQVTQESTKRTKGSLLQQESRYQRAESAENKRKDPEGAENTRPEKKRRCSGARFDDSADMKWIREEVTSIREELLRIVADAREDRRAIKGTLKQLLDQLRRKK